MSSVKTSHNPWGGPEELRDKKAKGSSAFPPCSSTKTAGGRGILRGPQKSQHLGTEDQGEAKNTGKAGNMSSNAHLLGRRKAQNMSEPQSSTNFRWDNLIFFFLPGFKNHEAYWEI